MQVHVSTMSTSGDEGYSPGTGEELGHLHKGKSIPYLESERARVESIFPVSAVLIAFSSEQSSYQSGIFWGGIL